MRQTRSKKREVWPLKKLKDATYWGSQGDCQGSQVRGSSLACTERQAISKKVGGQATLGSKKTKRCQWERSIPFSGTPTFFSKESCQSGKWAKTTIITA